MADAYADDEIEQDAEAAPAQEITPAEKLQAILAAKNLAADLAEQPEGVQKLAEIARLAIDGYELDDRSRADWKTRTKAAMDLAMLLTSDKDYPFPKASNIKYPLLTAAALQFNARAYGAIIQGDRAAKCKVNGHDKDGSKSARAERVSEHMSWQLLSEMPEWEEDTDRLLLILPIVGSVFRKRYWDPTLGRQCSRLVTADRLVMNYRARSIKDVPRISEEMMLYPYEIKERIRDGRFVEFIYGDAPADTDDPNAAESDEQTPHKFIEQHRLLDLDGDGYDEPYIVTIHLETEKVCRIVPNFTTKTVRVHEDGRVAAIRKQDYYTQYTFLPSPDGGIYGMGLGWLLLSTNEAINSTMNLMMDAGHLANIQGGFISATAGLKEKSFKLRMGEFKVVQSSGPINSAIMPVTFPGPSDVLFKLLGLLIEQGQQVSSIQDVMTGDTGGKVMAPTTTLALIEQSLKVFNAIFKRTHRSVRQELQMHVRLNQEHLTPEAYNEFFDGPDQYDPKADYDGADNNISPVSDPTVSTNMQKLAKAQVIAEIAANNPLVNPMEATKRRLEAAEIEDVDSLLMKPPEPDPAELAFADAMKKMTLQEMVAKIGRIETQSLKDVADAEAAEEGSQLSFYEQYRRMLESEHSMEQDDAAAAASGPGGIPGMEGAPGNEMGAPDAGVPDAGDGAGGAGPAMGTGGGGSPAMGEQPAHSSSPAGAM